MLLSFLSSYKKRFYLLCLAFLWAGCAFAQNAADANYHFLFKLQTEGITADWTEDFDTAAAKAQAEHKLILIYGEFEEPKREWVLFGKPINKRASIWFDEKLKEYVAENFVCVFMSILRKENKTDEIKPGVDITNTINPVFAERHFEVLKNYEWNVRHRAIILNIENGKYTNARLDQKTALGLMDDFELAKTQVIDGYEKKKIVDDPEATLSDPSGIGTFEYMENWVDDFELAKKLSEEKHMPILVLLGENIEMRIKKDILLQEEEMKAYLYKNFICFKLGLIRAEEVGKYKFIRAKPKVYASNFAKQNEEYLNKFDLIISDGLARYWRDSIYDVQSGKNAFIFLPLGGHYPSVADIIAGVELAKMNLELGQDAYVFPKNAENFSADWVEDYEFAKKKAIAEKKQIFVLQLPGKTYLQRGLENYIFGTGSQANIWGAPELKKYMNENFVCVGIALKYVSRLPYANSSDISLHDKHNELISAFNEGFARIVDPITEKSVYITPTQKTALGLMDDFEIAKTQLLEAYVQKKILDNPNAVIYPPLQRSALNTMPEKILFWEDDFDKALKQAKQEKKMLLIEFSANDVESRIRKSKIFTNQEFKNYTKESFLFVKVGMEERREIGKYKYIYEQTCSARVSQLKNKHDKLISRLKIDDFTSVIYDPTSNQSVDLPSLTVRPDTDKKTVIELIVEIERARRSLEDLSEKR